LISTLSAIFGTSGSRNHHLRTEGQNSQHARYWPAIHPLNPKLLLNRYATPPAASGRIKFYLALKTKPLIRL